MKTFNKMRHSFETLKASRCEIFHKPMRRLILTLIVYLHDHRRFRNKMIVLRLKVNIYKTLNKKKSLMFLKKVLYQLSHLSIKKIEGKFILIFIETHLIKMYDKIMFTHDWWHLFFLQNLLEIIKYIVFFIPRRYI